MMNKYYFNYQFGAKIFKIPPFSYNISGVGDELEKAERDKSIDKHYLKNAISLYLKHCESSAPEIIRYNILVNALTHELGTAPGTTYILFFDPPRFTFEIQGASSELLLPLSESLKKTYNWDSEVINKDKKLKIYNKVPSFTSFLRY